MATFRAGWGLLRQGTTRADAGAFGLGEKTFPDELWKQFARLTGWTKPAHQRPKYWGVLVTELVYRYMDADVAQWLQDNAPKPEHGQNYHQWLTSQYGLQRLVEHIWKLIGVASTVETMDDLRYKMRELYGDRNPFQYRLPFMSTETRRLPARTAQLQLDV